MASDKAQVVFMVDTRLPKNAGASLEHYYRSLCLATLRILLYLSQFPIREHLNRVLWNFKLFNSERAEKSAKTWQFHENRSEHIERFFQQLHDSLEQSEKSIAEAQLSRHKNTSQKPIRFVYNALAAVVQDFIWDAPEIMSPIRPMKRGRVVRNKAAATSSSSLKAKEISSCDKNMVIILSSCPATDREMRKFCYGPSIIEEGSQTPVAMATIAEQLLPPALLTQLSSKGIAVHWVHTGGALTEAGGAAKMVPPGLSLMSDVLKKAGGTLIPLSTLVTPLAPQLKIQNSSIAPQLPPAPLTAVEIDSNKVPTSCSAASPVDVRSVSSIDSELMMHPPSLPKVRPSTLPSRDLLSSLVLPPPTSLKEYLLPPAPRSLRGCGSSGRGISSDRPVAALRGNNLLWFSTRDGNILFIVELQPMCHLLTPNLSSETSTTVMGQAAAARRHSTERGGRAREREREREREGQKGVTASRRILLRKKLSFSKALKNNSENSSGQEDTSGTQTSEADSQSTLENSILHSTLSTSERIPPVVSSSTLSPSMMAVGLVRQADLPLSWLDPTSVFSCNGLYVPRDTRNSLSSRGNSIDKSPEPSSGETFTSIQSPPCILTSASFTPCTPTCLGGVKLFPVVRLHRCPLSVPDPDHARGNQSDRRKRTNSVPKDILCSLSKEDSMAAGEENKENKSTEKMIRLKSSRSLPSSPVVLCTKLQVPLLKGQHGSKHLPPPLSLSLAVSPQLLQRKMREAQESNETHKSKVDICTDPKECLHKSGRYCSRQYQNLCLWLAKNSLLLVVKVTVEGEDGSSCLGVLQPVTSLVSTLSLLKPQHHTQLLKKMVNPPPPLSLLPSVKESVKTSTDDSTSVKFVSVSLKSRRQPARKCRTASQVLQNISRSSTLEEGSGGREEREASSMEERENCPEEGSGFMASCASDSELYTGLQLLFKETKSNKNLCDDSVQCCLLSALADAPPFTHLPLLPWFSYSQHSSVSSQDIERLQELQLDIKDSEYGEIQRKSRLLSSLKELYSCGQGPAAALMADRESLEPSSPSVQDQQIDQPMLEEVEVDGCSLPSVSSTEELCEWFLSRYEEQTKLHQDGDSLLRWCTRTLSRFHSSFTQLELPTFSSPPPQEFDAVESETRLWELLHSKGVLLSNKQLGSKYEKMVKDKMEGEGEGVTTTDAAGEEKEEEREREGGCSLQERKITEHLLQILLHFESLKLCSSIELETKMAAANTLVILFRKLSLLANPGLVGSCLKKIILPVYLSSCQEVLTEVYTQLMLPLPSDLSSSPDRPLSPPTVDPSAVEGEGGEEGESSEEWTPLASLEEPPAAPKLAELGVKRLARHTSFHDNQSHRQITIMNKKMKRKRKRQSKPKQKMESSHPPRRSPRIAKLSDLGAQQKGGGATGRSVCRSLFSRSMSVSCEVGSRRKREREEGEGEGGEREGAENQLAKRRKSIHSLQRHHTVMEGASLFKSPRKSFYSGANVPRRVTTPLFKTPPLKENTGRIRRNGAMLSPRILLNKEPSPAAIYSLLHGNIVSPHNQQDGSGLTRTPCKSTKDVAIVAAAAALTVSPHARGKLERTPESKGQSSRDLSFTPLGHRGGSGLAPPRDLSLMLSPGVLASYLVSNTPLSLARSGEKRGGGTQLTTSHCALTSCGGGTAEGVRRSGFKSARMLTYENEDPLRKNSGRSKSSTVPDNSAPLETDNSTTEHPSIGPSTCTRGEEKNSQRTSTNCSRRVHGSSSSADSDCNIFLISPPDVAPPPLPVTMATVGGASMAGSGSSVCLLTDLDPSIENESASMMAFALSTPTKDDPRDFLDAFD